jgi:hypothetical protein
MSKKYHYEEGEDGVRHRVDNPGGFESKPQTIRKGKFTLGEDILMLHGEREEGHGKNALISSYLPNR